MNCKSVSDSTIGSVKIKPRRKRKRRRPRKRTLSNFEDCISGRGGSDDMNREVIPMWYWSNYYKALEWHNKHKLMLWKSYALALQGENEHLLSELRRLAPRKVFHAPATFHYLEKINKVPCVKSNNRSNRKQDIEDGANFTVDEGIEFEMSEEMIKFFQQSIKHKMEMKKAKVEACEEFEKEVKGLQEAHLQREKEMKLLYGDGSSKIIGMETAVTLSFDKYCDKKSPKYWPNIPLNM